MGRPLLAVGFSNSWWHSSQQAGHRWPVAAAKFEALSYAYAYDNSNFASLTSFLCFACCFVIMIMIMLMLTCEPGLKCCFCSRQTSLTAFSHLEYVIYSQNINIYQLILSLTCWLEMLWSLLGFLSCSSSLFGWKFDWKNIVPRNQK